MIDLKKEKEIIPVRSEICVGLGWYPNQRSWNAKKDKHSYDLDLSAFMLGADGKLVSDDFFVFYNNTDSPDGAVFLQSDNRTGVGAGDDETLVVDLSIVDPRVTEIVFVASVFEPKEPFGTLKKANVRIYDAMLRKDLGRCQLNTDFHKSQSVEVSCLHKLGERWHYKPIRKGYDDGVECLIEKYERRE